MITGEDVIGCNLLKVRPSDTQLSIHTAETYKITGFEFSLLSDEETRRISVLGLTGPKICHRNKPSENGPNDLRLGSTDIRMACTTCENVMMKCVGHYSHVDFQEPIYHIYYIDDVMKVLQVICFFCSSLLLSDEKRQQILEMPNQYRLQEVHKHSKSKMVCKRCNSPVPKYKRKGLGIRREWKDKTVWQDEEQKNYLFNRPLFPSAVKTALANVTEEDKEVMGYSGISLENMVPNAILIPPPTIRPSIMRSSGERARGQDDLTRQASEIIKCSNAFKDAFDPVTDMIHQWKKLEPLWEKIMISVAGMVNNNVKGMPEQPQRSGQTTRCLRERITGKHGIMRGKCGGKRVDNSARTVIGPETLRDIDEIGVPRDIVLELLFPERVNHLNLAALQKRVLSGPGRIDGARYVVDSNGNEIDLAYADRTKIMLQKGWYVKRPIQDGEWCAVNRHPSLTKHSLMGHRVRILGSDPSNKITKAMKKGDRVFQLARPEKKTKVLRLHLAVTAAYNGDFDGDEMQVHAPLNLQAQAEIQEIMSVPKQLLNGQNNKPVVGLIQDAVLAAYELSKSSTFLKREEVMQLSGWITDFGMELPVPCVLKPTELWSGRQLWSLMFPDTLYFVQGKEFLDKDTCVIKNGLMLSGLLTKNTLNKIVHTITNDFSHQIACDYISNAYRVTTEFIHTHGFSVGMADCIVTKETTDKITALIDLSEKKIKEVYDLNTNIQKPVLEGKIYSFLKKVLNYAGRIAKGSLSSCNSLVQMLDAGSKGDAINLAQLTGCIGQQCINGKRVDTDIGGRSLSQFHCNDVTAKAFGFIRSCFASGLNPAEFFFHMMSGREGIVRTGVSTGETGYIQRRLMKSMESLHVCADGSVRNAEGHVVEFLYGEDGFDSECLEMVSTFFLLFSNDELMDFWCSGEEEYFKVLSNSIKDVRSGKISLLSPDLEEHMLVPINLERTIGRAKGVSCASEDSSVSQVLEFSKTLEDFPNLRCYVLWMLCPANLKFHALKSQQLTWVFSKISHRVRVSSIQTGETVGAVAASSVGEPTTQITLDFFHSSGVESKTVTSGVPRLKELFDASKKTSMPSTHVFLKPGVNHINFQARLVYTTFGMISKSIEVIQEDMPITHDNQDFHVICMSRLSSQPQKFHSKYLLRIVLNKSLMKKKGLTIDSVIRVLKRHCSPNSFFEFSHDSMDKWIVRLRPPQRSSEILTEKVSDYVLCGIPGISGSTQLAKFSNVILTIGSNLRDLWLMEDVIFAKTYSTDIHEINEIMGIEAAVNVLFHEIRNVFYGDGTYIDPRHIMLVVNTITFRGYWMPIRRHGLRQIDTGVTLKASFEECMEIFKDACAFREKDPLAGVTEHILVGNPIPYGTGQVKLLLDKEYEKKILNMKKQEITRTCLPKSRVCRTTVLKHIAEPLEPLPKWAKGFVKRKTVVLPPRNHSKKSATHPVVAKMFDMAVKQRKRMYYPPSPRVSRKRPRDSEPKERPREAVYRVSEAESQFNPFESRPASPTYNPSFSSYNPQSPSCNSSSFKPYNPESPGYDASFLAYPVSPAYNPASPAYNPASPVYNSASPKYTPYSPNQQSLFTQTAAPAIREELSLSYADLVNPPQEYDPTCPALAPQDVLNCSIADISNLIAHVNSFIKR